MSLHRTDIEAGIADLFEVAAETVEITRGDETIEVAAIVEKPTREIETSDGPLYADTPRQPFVIKAAAYKFENVEVEPTKADVIVWRCRRYQVWTQGNTSHVDPGPFGAYWRIYTIDEGTTF